MQFLRSTRLFLAIVLLAGLFPPRAHAYIDPGTGSYVFQLLIATLLGALFTVKVYWRRIVLYLRGLLDKRNGSKKNAS